MLNTIHVVKVLEVSNVHNCCTGYVRFMKIVRFFQHVHVYGEWIMDFVKAAITNFDHVVLSTLSLSLLSRSPTALLDTVHSGDVL